MNKKVKIALGILVLTATSLYAADGGLGTSNDPVVTKSYVDQKIAALNTSGSAEVTKELAAQQALIELLLNEVEALKANSNNVYEVVTIEAGQSILGMQGSEMIVRAGEGLVIGSAAGGVQDMTNGTDIEHNSLAPKYHLLIIPREDGRGLKANKRLTVMVRGGYRIVE